MLCQPTGWSLTLPMEMNTQIGERLGADSELGALGDRNVRKVEMLRWYTIAGLLRASSRVEMLGLTASVPSKMLGSRHTSTCRIVLPSLGLSRERRPRRAKRLK